MPATKTSPTTPREVAVLAATGTPGGFARVASGGKWHLPRHLQLLNRYLSELAARRIKRLIVQEPPRHGKSEFCSKYFPAWYTGTFPHHRTALCSYEANFAAEWGGKSRELLERWGSLFKTRVKQNSRASDNWATDAGGGMVTTGIGGPLTGRGCNCLIIDDPIKNAEESLSPTIRDRHWDWWQSTASTRLEPDGVVLVLMTRWNDDDLVGRIMAAEPGVWTVLSLPAIAGENDALGRQPGEARAHHDDVGGGHQDSRIRSTTLPLALRFSSDAMASPARSSGNTCGCGAGTVPASSNADNSSHCSAR